MGEASVTPGTRARRLSGLGELVYEVANADAHAQTWSVPSGVDGDWERVTAGAFATDVSGVAKGLVAAGVGEGDRVLLVADNHHDWVRVAFAVWTVRAVLVPLPSVASAERVAHVVRSARPAAAVVEGRRAHRVVAGMQRELPDLGRVWRLTPGLPEVVSLGAYMDASAVRFRREAASAEDPAVIAFPLSTVSRSMRGVVLTHGALLAAGADVVDRMWPRLSALDPGAASALLDEPLSQAQGLASLVACVAGRVRVGLGRPGALRASLGEFRPTVVVCGASLLTSVYDEQRAAAKSTGWDSLGTFNASVDAAVQFDRSPKKGAWRRLSRSMYDWSFSKVREVFGGRVHLIVCWGGALPEKLDAFYTGVGMPVMQVWGCAETAGVFAANGPDERVAGSVGRALPGREVWASREGEVFVRGGAVFSGYWDDGEGSRSAFREGWLATGLAAEVDGDGVVWPRGRVRVQSASAAVPGRFVAGAAAAGPGVGGPAQVGPAPGGEVRGGEQAPGGAGAGGGLERRAVGPAPAAPAGPAAAQGASEGAATMELPVVGGSAPGGGAVGPVEPSDAELVAGLEARLRAHPLISQVMVIVEGRPFASALVTLVRDQLEYWRLVNGRPLSMAAEEIAGDRDLLREVQGLVYEANRSVPRRLAVRSFHVLAEEFTAQSGLVLASGELRREAVLRAFSEEIEGLYRSRP
ncbi:AMP-binding protein [Nocardiopsis sp. HNM0947]|uniref:AMP-binding protein n=1 Tax=Nocardiopsis coralli TaxID=2772213 RepID=A0ABR9PCQ5_9ACTN|nr:AMP-binding protein [Nocardiopsis coralli]MBE3001618.1 AMP-binding protein [Nocardiopsis coralli]